MPGSDNDVDSGLKQSTPPDMDIPEADLGLVLQNHDIYTVQLIFLILAFTSQHISSP